MSLPRDGSWMDYFCKLLLIFMMNSVKVISIVPDYIQVYLDLERDIVAEYIIIIFNNTLQEALILTFYYEF